MPVHREWVSILICMNAARLAIPSFYVFRGTCFRYNYIQRSELGATMAMQPWAWMITYIFTTWISHFIESVQQFSGISQDQQHVLILNGHTSLFTLEVIHKAWIAGLYLLTLPSYTSHALQSHNVSIFESFKQHFRAYRDFWTSRNMSLPATKETLAYWVSLGLRKASSLQNIRSSFYATGIYSML